MENGVKKKFEKKIYHRGIYDVRLLGDDVVRCLKTVNNTYYNERETLTHAP